MKSFGIVLMMMLLAHAGMSQAPGELKAVENAADGGYVVTGVDPLGADVTVVYNADLMKTYQERTIDGETVYARYANGSLTDYGVYIKPMALDTKNDVLFSSKDE